MDAGRLLWGLLICLNGDYKARNGVCLRKGPFRLGTEEGGSPSRVCVRGGARNPALKPPSEADVRVLVNVLGACVRGGGGG